MTSRITPKKILWGSFQFDFLKTLSISGLHNVDDRMVNEYGAVGGIIINELVSDGSQHVLIPFVPYSGHLFYLSSAAVVLSVNIEITCANIGG